MKIFSFTLLFSTTIFFYSNAQSLILDQNLKLQATKMSEAFLNGDYTAFSYYTYPEILK